MVALDEWTGLVVGRHDSFDEVSMVAPIAPSGNSWSGPFRIAASDGNQYFVKSIETCPPGSETSLVAELVVAGAGILIEAPVCTTTLVRIPPAFDGWELRPGVRLRAGLAHGSLALSHADEYDRPRLAARTQDDNARRHVGVYALYDWCFGSDPQWLYDLDNDRTLYSHDHGFYLPPAGLGRWSAAELLAQADTPRVLPDPPTGLLPSAVDNVAALLESVKRDALIGILSAVPSSWPAAEEDLETVGWFLEHRAPAVASRLRSLVTGGGLRR